MWTYVLGPFLALLPARWRAAWFWDKPADWVRATILSGFLETFGCFLSLALWYLASIQRMAAEQAAVAVDALGKAKDLKGLTNIELAYSMGLGGLLTFVGHPLTWLLAYCAFEGIWRMFAAIVTEEAPGSGLLGFFDWAVVSARRRAYEKRVPLIEDRLTRSEPGPRQPDWDLRVESCRPKPSWRPRQIVGYKDEYFRVLRDSTDTNAQWRRDGLPIRPHTYYLKKIPAGEAYVGSEKYDPRDVLKPAGPGLGTLALGALKDGFKIQATPLVADNVRRDMEGQDVFLHIESCRPKEQWNPGRTLKYEDCYYRIEGSYELEGPRPWGYKLRLLPMGVMGRGVILYDPEELLKLAARDKER